MSTSDLLALGYAEAEAITRARAKSFAFASVALDGPTRRAACAVYAFCRRCDDAVDEAKPGDDVRGRVARLRQELAAVYAGDDWDDAILAAFGDTVRSRGVPRDAFEELIEGMEQDLVVTRYERWDDLLRYCELAAGTVGRMMAAVFGVDDPGALVPAAALGRAMQLTNVLRDVREDLELHDRIYLPREALVERGIREEHLRGWVSRCGLDASAEADAFRALMEDAAERARRLYAFADRGIPSIHHASGRACVRLMRSTYASILDVLEARRWDPFVGRARTTTADKIRIGARAVLWPTTTFARGEA
jgi:phytoene synthase